MTSAGSDGYVCLAGGLAVPLEPLRLLLELEQCGFLLTREHNLLTVEPGQQLTEDDCAAICRWRWHLLALLVYPSAGSPSSPQPETPTARLPIVSAPVATPETDTAILDRIAAHLVSGPRRVWEIVKALDLDTLYTRPADTVYDLLRHHPHRFLRVTLADGTHGWRGHRNGPSIPEAKTMLNTAVPDEDTPEDVWPIVFVAWTYACGSPVTYYEVFLAADADADVSYSTITRDRALHDLASAAIGTGQAFEARVRRDGPRRIELLALRARDQEE